MRILALLSTVSQRLASRRILLVTAGLYGVCAVAMFLTSLPFAVPVVTARCGAPPPDVRLFTSSAELRRFLIDCGDGGRAAWWHLQLADLVFPMIYGLFLASALALVLTRLSRPGSPVIALAVLPLVGSAFDYLENLAAWAVLAAFPHEVPVAAQLLGVMSTGKQAATWMAWIVLIVALGRLLLHSGRRRRAARVDPGPPTSPGARQRILAGPGLFTPGTPGSSFWFGGRTPPAATPTRGRAGARSSDRPPPAIRTSAATVAHRSGAGRSVAE